MHRGVHPFMPALKTIWMPHPHIDFIQSRRETLQAGGQAVCVSFCCKNQSEIVNNRSFKAACWAEKSGRRHVINSINFGISSLICISKVQQDVIFMCQVCQKKDITILVAAPKSLLDLTRVGFDGDFPIFWGKSVL